MLTAVCHFGDRRMSLFRFCGTSGFCREKYLGIHRPYLCKRQSPRMIDARGFSGTVEAVAACASGFSCQAHEN